MQSEERGRNAALLYTELRIMKRRILYLFGLAAASVVAAKSYSGNVAHTMAAVSLGIFVSLLVKAFWPTR